MLIDTNLIIYAVQPSHNKLRTWIAETLPCCSVISRVEALGYHRLSEDGRRSLEQVFAKLVIRYPTIQTFEQAILLRRQRRMSLGDALIAATALEHRLTLATANIADFRFVGGLSVINPLEESI